MRSLTHELEKPLGVMNGARVRPTYLVPVSDFWRSKSSYPKTNARQVAPGVSVHWRLAAWRNVTDGYGEVQIRRVSAAIFHGDAFAGYFGLLQSKNATDDDLELSDYFDICDSQSQELADHAKAVATAMESLEDRPCLVPGEQGTEVSNLFIPREYLGSGSWAPAILTVLRRLALKVEGGELLCVLKAAPLELVWRDKVGGPLDEKELRLAVRRKMALQRLYQSKLRFVCLPDGWMARWVRATDLD